MKLILENWRTYLNEELAATTPRKGRGIKRGTVKPMPIDQLLPVFFKVLLDDPETFDLLPAEITDKSFEEIKGRPVFIDFIDDMKREIEELLAALSRFPVIKDYLKDGYDRKAFLRFVQELPENKAIGAMSDRLSSGSVALISTAPNEIKLYACLFRSGVDPANILEDEFAKCRRETMVRIEEKLDK